MLYTLLLKQKYGIKCILWNISTIGLHITMKKGLLAPQNTFLDTIATRFDGTHSNFVLGNAQGAGCPVVYCSDGFCELTGYPRSQVMGRSCACKFLFGENTLADEKSKIEAALEHKTELKTELNFYRKDGEMFKCLLDIVPIKNEKSQVVLILVSHKEICEEKDKDDVNDDEKAESDVDSDEEMVEAYRRCQARRGRSAGELPGTAGYTNQRRRSRAVLYHLSGQFEKHNRANRAKTKLQQLNKFSSMSNKMPEYKVQEVKKSKFILVHYGIFKIGWDWLILLCTFYTAILVPYNAAFTRAEKKSQRDSIYSDVVVEVLFIFDIVFNFRTSFVNKSGQVVYEARLIALNYFKGWFLLDLLAAIPFDFLYIFNINTEAPVHLLKLARLIRLARLLQKIDRFSQYSALVLALLMSMFALLAHWLACIWYAIGHVEFEEHATASWLYELSERLHLNDFIEVNSTLNGTDVKKPDILVSYLSALYFTCSSLTSVGFGNVSANTESEKIFSVCAMIVGALMHAVVFGNVTALIQRMYQRRANFHSKTKDLKDFFRAYDIPKPLKQRMQEYFQTMWSMNNGIETNEILKDFPEEMKGELGLHLHKEILNLSIFEEATQGCLKSIALHTRRSFCAPGEFLVHKGDASNYLFLLVSGSMEILKMDMVVAILGKGDLFGSDIDFDDPISVCNYDVRSLTYSELQCINIKGLTDVLLLYPDFAEKFAKDIHNDLTYNLRQTGDGDSDEETTSSPKTRVCTLPSISEDDELSPSDDDDDDVKRAPALFKPATEEEDFEAPYTSQSMHSPLLSTSRLFPKLPNGDIGIENVHSPPTLRPWGIRRTGGIINRQSIKEARKIRLGHATESIDKIIPHIQNLQNEVEGTKGSISKLERKVTKIGQDICAIDRNMREILKHLTNISKIGPLEPLCPNTPTTPSLSLSQFNFELQDVPKREFVQGKPNEPKASPNSLTQDSTRPNSDNEMPTEATSKRRRSSLQVPLLLNPYDLTSRRHSDGTRKKNIRNQFQAGIPISKSDYNVRNGLDNMKEDDLGYRDTDRLINVSEDGSFVESDYTSSQGNIMVGSSREHLEEDSKPLLGGSSGFEDNDFVGKLKEVHTIDCRSPIELKVFSTSCDKDSICDSVVTKSRTFDKIKAIPKVNVSRDRSMPLLYPSQRERCNTGIHVPSNEQSGIYLETLQSARSKSCVEISPRPKRNVATTKSQSHDMLVTEFGAKTPNEVRTFHFRNTEDSVKDRKSRDGAISDAQASARSEDEFDQKTRDLDLIRNYIIDLPLNNTNGAAVTVKNCKSKDKIIDIDQSRNDSGHVSLFEATENESEGFVHSNATPDINEKNTDPIEGTYKRLNVRRLDVSPDSPTDASESLITDSVKTEDENIIEVDQESMSVNDLIAGLSPDGSGLRTTDL